MQLPNRLKIIGDFIKDNTSVADIGADHGLLEEYLSSRHSNCKIFSVENKKGPYEILKKKVSSLNGVEISLSDGLNRVKEGTDVVVLAGMGGINIAKILKENASKVPTFKRIIIDAHRDINLARETIISYGFKITEEKIVYEEEKYYIISVFDKVENPIKYNDDEILIGYNLKKDEKWPQYKEFLITQCNKAIEKISQSNNAEDKVLKFKKDIERIENYGKN